MLQHGTPAAMAGAECGHGPIPFFGWVNSCPWSVGVSRSRLSPNTDSRAVSRRRGATQIAHYWTLRFQQRTIQPMADGRM